MSETNERSDNPHVHEMNQDEPRSSEIYLMLADFKGIV